MKKTLILFIALILIFSLTSCVITLTREFELGQDANNIVSVDIYRIDEFDCEVHEIPDKHEPIYSITGDEIKPFISELSTLEYKRDAIFPLPIDYAHIFKEGYIVFIEYGNGGYDVYAEQGIYTHCFVEGNVYHLYDFDDYRGEKSWDDFIESYIGK